MSGRPIKMNELITVRFTALDPSLDRVALLTRQVSPLSAATRRLDSINNNLFCQMSNVAILHRRPMFQYVLNTSPRRVQLKPRPPQHDHRSAWRRHGRIKTTSAR